MVNLYAKLIRQGKMTVEDVPERWREQVRTKLEVENG
ncbi:MAG: CD1375 family protein [Oscillospiraceae bacterium]